MSSGEAIYEASDRWVVTDMRVAAGAKSACAEVSAA